MPLPRALGRFNRRVTNPLLGPLVTLLPWFAWLEHIGRKSGQPYRTPVLLFTSGDRRVIAMNYGPSTDWARNVLAAGRAVAVARGGRRLVLVGPRIVHDPSRRLVPPPIRPVLALIRASDFLVFDSIHREHQDPPGDRRREASVLSLSRLRPESRGPGTSVKSGRGPRPSSPRSPHP